MVYHASETGSVVRGSSAAQTILGYQPSSTTHLSPSRANPHGLSPQARVRHLGPPMKLIMGLVIVRLYPQGGKASSMIIINPSRS
ncbi:hypothetical protein K443DRAFT_677997 [Laccaria amethystina LaAM-08-1]|uniref:Unplaced genomic scaffold K443scaffold_64, whole genome shotgun sequence n=1 Tax=Laccaria amethystina LaAM-08-1 TaxID=1095629 RepID=A0A0C9XKJ8_9AGAR|nr:hypothetical protein K443DRAFT_677997 [Laccaria amethystina LaAM-08-1]